MRTTTDLFARFNLVGPSIDFDNPDNYYDDEGNFVIPDVLDFDTVPFETVEDELSMELFAQDEDYDRAYENSSCCCKKCGIEDDFDEGLLTRIGGEYRCKKCIPSPEVIEIMKEIEERRRERAWKAKVKKAQKWRAALDKAKELRPDLNWARYDNDPRMYPLNHFWA